MISDWGLVRRQEFREKRRQMDKKFVWGIEKSWEGLVKYTAAIEREDLEKLVSHEEYFREKYEMSTFTEE